VQKSLSTNCTANKKNESLERKWAHLERKLFEDLGISSIHGCMNSVSMAICWNSACRALTDSQAKALEQPPAGGMSHPMRARGLKLYKHWSLIILKLNELAAGTYALRSFSSLAVVQLANNKHFDAKDKTLTPGGI
jgi:hypothetical protein